MVITLHPLAFLGPSPSSVMFVHLVMQPHLLLAPCYQDTKASELSTALRLELSESLAADSTVSARGPVPVERLKNHPQPQP